VSATLAGSLLPLLLVASGVAAALLLFRGRTLPHGGRDPLDLGPALERLARTGRGLTPDQGELPHVTVIDPPPGDPPPFDYDAEPGARSPE
jgi:hypothetical protein